MRIRIHRDIAKIVNQVRRVNRRSANQEVNMALAFHYGSKPKAKRRVISIT